MKEAVDLDALGVNVEVITATDQDVLAHLAWHESVALAEKSLPILVLDDCSVVSGAINIKNILEGMV